MDTSRIVRSLRGNLTTIQPVWDFINGKNILVIISKIMKSGGHNFTQNNSLC